VTISSNAIVSPGAQFHPAMTGPTAARRRRRTDGQISTDSQDSRDVSEAESLIVGGETSSSSSNIRYLSRWMSIQDVPDNISELTVDEVRMCLTYCTHYLMTKLNNINYLLIVFVTPRIFSV